MPSTSTRSVAHSTFVIERSFPAAAERVFAAWSDLDLKRQWNSCHDDWRTEEHRLEFRIDGTEVSRTVEPDGTVHTMNARFIDIIPNQRIIYVYDMLLNDVRISVSLVSVTFESARGKTAMTFTEQVMFLDGYGDADERDERKEGTEVGLGRLAALLGSN